MESGNVEQIRKEEKVENLRPERVELHLHTKMSETDSVVDIQEVILQAVKCGHKAIAITDHNSVESFPKAMRVAKEAKKSGTPIKILYGAELCYGEKNQYHINVIASNSIGLNHLYQLITDSRTKKDKIQTTKETIQTLREGLIIGSGCEKGELFTQILNNIKNLTTYRKEILELASFYDFLEIQPAKNHSKKLLNIYGEEIIRTINQEIVEIGEELGIPVCATGDVHFLKQEDEIAWRILKNKSMSENLPSLFFHTTEEMLSEFSYLGGKISQKVVVENPNKIADRIEELISIHTQDYYIPVIENTEKLRDIVTLKAKQIYGEVLPQQISDRLSNELGLIENKSFDVYYLIAHKISKFSHQINSEISYRGTVGSSLTAFLAEITAINPLPPHYFCEHCHYTKFISDSSVASGYDLPEQICPICETTLKSDGHNIPFESFAGIDGAKVPDIDFNVIPQNKEKILNYIRAIFSDNNILNAGATNTISDSAANEMIELYDRKYTVSFTPDAINRIQNGLIGVKRCNGYHPTNFLFVPNDCKSESFTPAQYAEGKMATHFEFHDLPFFIIWIFVNMMF